MKWNMQREEKQEKVAKKKDEEEEIMEWRAMESTEMSQYLAEKQHDINLVELQESKEFQEFKRECKAAVKEESLKSIEEQYINHKENSLWNVDLAKAVNEQTKEIIADRLDNRKEIQEIEKRRREQSKIEQEEDRVMQMNVEMQNMAKQLQLEKEALLQSLEHVRQSQVKAPLARRTSSGSKPLRN